MGIAADEQFRQVSGRQGHLPLASQRDQAFHTGQGDIAQIDLLHVQYYLPGVGPLVPLWHIYMTNR